jgi:hypothetical protein
MEMKDINCENKEDQSAVMKELKDTFDGMTKQHKTRLMTSIEKMTIVKLPYSRAANEQYKKCISLLKTLCKTFEEYSDFQTKVLELLEYNRPRKQKVVPREKFQYLVPQLEIKKRMQQNLVEDDYGDEENGALMSILFECSDEDDSTETDDEYSTEVDD